MLSTFLAWKLALPRSFHMTRGNHETRNMNKIYGFEGEVKHKYDERTFELFLETFRWLPLGAVIAKSVFVVHGGLFSKDGVTVESLKSIDRNREPPDGEEPMTEMLWSDPQPFSGRGPNKRGVGVAFGPDVTKEFLDTNGLSMVVRSHEVKDEGYLVEHGGLLVTVFSAPNYCDQMGNKGAFIKFGEDMKPEYTKFDAVEHPPIRPMAYASNLGMFGF